MANVGVRSTRHAPLGLGFQELEPNLRYLKMEPAIKAGNLQAPEIEDFFSPALILGELEKCVSGENGGVLQDISIYASFQ